MKSSLRLGVSPAWACFLLSFSILQAAPVVGGWRPAGPYGASVESVVFSGNGTDNGQGLLAVTSNAFLYRSRDGGQSWSIIRFPAQHASLAHALAVDPNRQGSFVVGVSSSNPALAGLYQTVDDGATWQHVLRDAAVFSAAYAKSDPKVIAAGTRHGVQLSADGGATWKQISPVENKELQPVMSLGFDPRNPAVLYAGTPHLPWKTADGGATWNSIHHGMLDDSDILALIVNQQKPEQLFIGACSGIYRSDNSAGRWTKLLGITGAGFRTYSVSLDPSKPETVYSGTRDGLWKSADLGKTWRKLAPNIVKAVAVSPADPKVIILATEDAGVLRSRDGGESFEDSSKGLADRRMTRMAPSGRHVLVTMGKDSSTLQANLEDPQWKRVRMPAPNVQQISSHGKTLVAYSGSASWRSSDHGLTWKPLPVLPAGTLGFGVSQSPLAATAKAVYRLAPNDASWQPATALGLTAGPIRKLWTTRSGNGPAWIEAGTSIWSTHDAGKTWAIATLPVRSGEVYELESSSSVEPAQGGCGAARCTPAVLWAATARGLFRSHDAGKTWKLCDKGIDGGSTTPAIAVHPAKPLEAFASQYGRIFRTQDGGESWSEVPVEGLHGASIASLAVTGATEMQLVALTSARGVFVQEIKALDAGAASAAAAASPAATNSSTTNPNQEK